MKKIIDINEKEEIINKIYDNNWIKSLKERDPKWYNDIMNSYDIFKTDDNFNIIIHYEKFGIDSDLYFDDEYEIPNKSEELFINYNMQKISRYCLDLTTDVFVYKAYRNNDDCLIPSQTGYGDRIYDGTFVRFLTNEEKKIIQEIYEDIKSKYLKRLKNYYKRYSNKIYCIGYWANR